MASKKTSRRKAASASKKTGGAPKGPRGPNKSEFIRSLGNAPAADVVAKGKEAGLTFSTAFVYAVRSKSRAGGKPAAAPKGKPGRKPAAARAATGSIAAFKRMALDLGLGVARTALDDLERGLAALLG